MSRLDTIMGLRLSKAFQYSGKEGSIRNCFSGTLAQTVLIMAYLPIPNSQEVFLSS